MKKSNGQTCFIASNICWAVDMFVFQRCRNFTFQTQFRVSWLTTARWWWRKRPPDHLLHQAACSCVDKPCWSAGVTNLICLMPATRIPPTRWGPYDRYKWGYTSTCQGYNPSYAVLRPLKGVTTPFIPGRAHLYWVQSVFVLLSDSREDLRQSISFRKPGRRTSKLSRHRPNSAGRDTAAGLAHTMMSKDFRFGHGPSCLMFWNENIQKNSTTPLSFWNTEIVYNCFDFPDEFTFAFWARKIPYRIFNKQIQMSLICWWVSRLFSEVRKKQSHIGYTQNDSRGMGKLTWYVEPNLAKKNKPTKKPIQNAVPQFLVRNQKHS